MTWLDFVLLSTLVVWFHVASWLVKGIVYYIIGKGVAEYAAKSAKKEKVEI